MRRVRRRFVRALAGCPFMWGPKRAAAPQIQRAVIDGHVDATKLYQRFINWFWSRTMEGLPLVDHSKVFPGVIVEVEIGGHRCCINDQKQVSVDDAAWRVPPFELLVFPRAWAPERAPGQAQKQAQDVKNEWAPTRRAGTSDVRPVPEAPDVAV